MPQAIAVLIPCFNEELTVAKVIKDFRHTLPSATIYVCDNNSTDRTAEYAKKAGATVIFETKQGKGNAVRRMFADIDADTFLLVDGDGTYDTKSAPAMLKLLKEESLDMVVGIRREHDASGAAYRQGHTWGNKLFNKIFSTCFEDRFSDIFSGYRAFSKRFVKSFPALSSGFEIETEISIHSVELALPTKEMSTPYFARPKGSESKLNTYQDGLKILWTITRLYKDVFPFRFFCGIATLLALISLALGVPVIAEWLETGLVPRFPTAILASGIMILSMINFTCGLILESVTRGRLENKRLFYLGLPPVGLHDSRTK